MEENIYNLDFANMKKCCTLKYTSKSTPMFIATLFTIVKRRKQSKCQCDRDTGDGQMPRQIGKGSWRNSDPPQVTPDVITKCLHQTFCADKGTCTGGIPTADRGATCPGGMGWSYWKFTPYAGEEPDLQFVSGGPGIQFVKWKSACRAPLFAESFPVTE